MTQHQNIKSSFLDHLQSSKDLISPHLTKFVQDATTHSRLRQAMVHGIQGSGKFIRPHLVLTFAGTVSQNSIDLACAIEILHSYSLIHDDLPCMDNANLRRGMPSVWDQFDEATAVLAGDAMIPLAYDLLAKLEVDPDIKIELIKKFSHCAGGHGLVAGQMMDLYPSSDLSDIKQMQLLKTGALLSFSCEAGHMLAHGLNSPQLGIASDFGFKLGLIYQITDDLLNVCGTSDQMGKPINTDGDKITFISVFGIDHAKQMAQDLTQELYELALEFKPIHPCLENLIHFVHHRTS